MKHQLRHAGICISLLLISVLGYISFSHYSFRFGYHPPSWRATGAQNSFERAVDDCYTGNDADRTKFMVCAKKKLIPGVQQWGMNALLTVLEARQVAQRDNSRITQCHDLTHAIGEAGVYLTKNLSAVLGACTNTCVYGCQHGAVSAWYRLGNDIMNHLHTVCVDGDWTKNRQAQGGCFHEIGHAVASAAGNDIIKALRYCDQVADIGRIDCGYGVFMELFEPATFANAPQPLPPNHPAWCGDLWSPYKEYCYAQAGVNDYGRNQDDDRAFSICRTVPSVYQQHCFHNLGTNIFYVYQYKDNQSKAIEDFCRKTGDSFFMPCIAGALLSSVMAQSNSVDGIRLCQGLMGEERRSCFTIFGATLENRRTPQEKLDICRSLVDVDARVCEASHTHQYQ